MITAIFVIAALVLATAWDTASTRPDDRTS
jgi:hypothetical protein